MTRSGASDYSASARRVAASARRSAAVAARSRSASPTLPLKEGLAAPAQALRDLATLRFDGGDQHTGQDVGVETVRASGGDQFAELGDLARLQAIGLGGERLKFCVYIAGFARGRSSTMKAVAANHTTHTRVVRHSHEPWRCTPSRPNR